eukprot:CAMPEP_0118885520 /NCGR_PEP_ID=MMETSP1163-20130328/23938_1 /TAXON_ID=124430 /ORGANISM="Phaeomonas parva, Strain CCMP2877" /LENGTH=312 /DNA_ID=CAMNT_0006823549 /DNA_START=374 /DNA_END=1312 /DNA_ORIENTATION=+
MDSADEGPMRHSMPGRLVNQSAEILAIHDSRDRRSIDLYNQRLAERLRQLERESVQCFMPARGASQVRRELVVRSALATTKAVDDVVQRLKVPGRGGKMVQLPFQIQQKVCAMWYTPFFGEGTTFDALDIFIHENKRKERWRPAICQSFPRPMREPKLRLHWVGFTSDWDQTIDLSTGERSRIVHALKQCHPLDAQNHWKRENNLARVKIIREKGRPTCRLVDALDVFVDSRGTSRKWRAAVIFLEYQTLICIRWLGYTETWDEVLDLNDETDRERIATQGTHVTEEALEKQRERARKRALHGIEDESPFRA